MARSVATGLAAVVVVVDLSPVAGHCCHWDSLGHRFRSTT